MMNRITQSKKNIRVFLVCIFAAALAAAALALGWGGFPARAEDIEDPRLALNYSPSDGYFNRSSITARVTNVAQPEKWTIYHATATEETKPDWHTEDSVVWTKGDTVTLEDGPDHSAAFLCVLIAQPPESGSYDQLTGASEQPFKENADGLENFAVDTAAPLVRFNGETVRLGGEYFVDQAVTFADTEKKGFASGIREIKVERVGKESPAALAAELPATVFPLTSASATYSAQNQNALDEVLQNGLTIYANPEEQEDVTITVRDMAGNTAAFNVSLGLPPLSRVSYAEIWNKATPSSYPARARAELKETYPVSDGERYNAFNDAIRAIERAYNMLNDTVVSFQMNLLSLSNFSKDTIPATAKTFAETDVLLAKLGESQFPKDTLRQEKADYAAKKAAFRKVRFTEKGITLNVSEETLPDNADTYQYYLAVSKEEKNLSKYDKLVSLKGSKLKQVFTLKLMNLADGTDVSELLSGSAVTLRVEPEGFGKDLPLAGIFSEGAFSVSDTVTGPDGSLTVTLANGLAQLGLLATDYVHPFLLYGLPIIGIVLLAAAVAVVLIFVMKKRTAQPDEKISELEGKLEQQRQVNEIARKAKEEEERINREREEETARLRQEAIERVKEERRKALEEKERQLREQAEKEQSALAAAQLAEFERLAAERAAAAKEADASGKAPQKGGKKQSASKTGKSAGKTAAEKKPAKSAGKKSQKKPASAPPAKEAESVQTAATEQAAATKLQSPAPEQPEMAAKKPAKKKSTKKK